LSIVSFFSRRRSNSGVDAPDIDQISGAEPDSAETSEPAFDRAEGPFDETEVSDVGSRIDLGALLIHGVDGAQIRLELDSDRTSVTGVSLTVGDSSMQLQAFAAPRSGGLWAQVRSEIADSVAAQGGTADEDEGRFGIELRSRMPSASDEGRTVFAPVRFLGVDGPRWFLRGVIAGKAAEQPDDAAEIEDLFRSVVVVRGTTPMPPRDLIPLHMPKSTQSAI